MSGPRYYVTTVTVASIVAQGLDNVALSTYSLPSRSYLKMAVLSSRCLICVNTPEGISEAVAATSACSSTTAPASQPRPAFP